MPTRTAHARWDGNLETGKGHVDFGGGSFSGAYSFASRFEEGAGTNPAELLGAAHASCLAMALALQHAETAKAHCPVSQALAGTEITLDAKLGTT